MAMPVHAFPADDTLNFKLHTVRLEVQDTAQIRVPVTALVQGSTKDPAVLDAKIRQSLQCLLAADWVFSAIRREGEAVGYERVSLTATARVALGEIYNLKERARQASNEGLELGNPDVNYKLPTSRVTQANEAMRLKLLQDVVEKLPTFETATGRAWRIGRIEFGVRDAVEEEPRFSKGGYRAASEESLDLEEGLTGGERFSLLADVTLCSPRLV
jgi:hypothetical protein